MAKRNLGIMMDAELVEKIDQHRLSSHPVGYRPLSRSEWLARAAQDRLSALLDRWDADNVSGFTPRTYQLAGQKMVAVNTGPDDLYFPNADILVTEEDAKTILEAQQPSPDPPASEEG